MKKMIFVILVFASNASYAEKSLMRLFYSPAERAAINSSRHTTELKPGEIKAAQPSTDVIEVKGYISRSDSQKVVWINDKNTLKTNKLYEDVRVVKVNSNGKVKLRVSGDGIVNVKPGQVVMRNEHRTVESYEK